jgi:glycolate oxidase subunit GlcD
MSDQHTLSKLETAFSHLRIDTSPEMKREYGRDWTRFYEPNPLAVIFPKSVQDVQDIVKFSVQERLNIVPSGGRTGLSGGAVAQHQELVISFDAMNQIKDFNPVEQTVVCEAGVITQSLQEFARAQQLFYPVDFASAGSSQIGGNIATNAGGINVIRYGMTRDWVLGLVVVTGAGEVLQLNQGLAKNNTGYDLRHLFIGAEGTLGLIVEATMKLAPAPKKSSVLILGAPSMPSVMSILEQFRSNLTLIAFEFFSEAALSEVVTHAQVKRPVQTKTPFYALIECECPDEQAEADILTSFESCVNLGFALDGAMSQSRAQAAALWRCREDISETISRYTPYKNDISVTVSQVPDFLTAIDEIVGHEYPEFRIIWFGHIGDGNVHLNILKPDTLTIEAFVQKCEKVSPKIFSAVQKFGGSVSAEHGVGLLKKKYLNYTRSTAEIELMRGIKRVFDPAGVFNPGKIFD